jgi:hypothetical protein
MQNPAILENTPAYAKESSDTLQRGIIITGVKLLTKWFFWIKNRVFGKKICKIFDASIKL